LSKDEITGTDISAVYSMASGCFEILGRAPHALIISSKAGSVKNPVEGGVYTISNGIGNRVVECALKVTGLTIDPEPICGFDPLKTNAAYNKIK